jgi:hypothetical protein
MEEDCSTAWPASSVLTRGILLNSAVLNEIMLLLLLLCHT